MRKVLLTGVLAAALAASLSPTGPAAAAPTHDGAWTVLVITEKGTCDRAYRYNVRVDGGHIAYEGQTSANINGTVASNGAVKVSIRMGDKAASGTGKLSASSGTGNWQGVGGNEACGGRWEAERR